MIEAIDQPWKRVLEGTVGGYWGILDVNLAHKFSLTEAVAERSDSKVPLYFCAFGMLLFVVIACNLKQKNGGVLIGLASLGGLTSLNALLQYEYLIAASRDWIEWFALGGLALLGLLLSFTQIWWLSRPTTRLESIISGSKQLFLYAAIVTSYLIATDGRYRDFPIILFALPLSILSFGLWSSSSIRCSNSRFNLMLCLLAILLAIYCWALELSNTSAMMWLLLNIALVLANWPLKMFNNRFTSK